MTLQDDPADGARLSRPLTEEQARQLFFWEVSRQLHKYSVSLVFLRGPDAGQSSNKEHRARGTVRKNLEFRRLPGQAVVVVAFSARSSLR